MIPPILTHFLNKITNNGDLTEQEILEARYEARLHMNFVYVQTKNKQAQSRKYLDIDEDLKEIEEICTTILFFLQNTTRNKKC